MTIQIGTNGYGVDIEEQIFAVVSMEIYARTRIYKGGGGQEAQFWRTREKVLRAILVTLRQVKEMQDSAKP